VRRIGLEELGTLLLSPLALLLDCSSLELLRTILLLDSVDLIGLLEREGSQFDR
jgi:hypothetical protein|tara:strand:+ start:562 stop:723 length:162 start_codon:yes stop_codon:yes gene_type:complete